MGKQQLQQNVEERKNKDVNPTAPRKVHVECIKAAQNGTIEPIEWKKEKTMLMVQLNIHTSDVYPMLMIQPNIHTSDVYI